MGKRLILIFVEYLVDFSINVEEPLSNAVNRKNSKLLVRSNESGVILNAIIRIEVLRD
jgi:hypothetical protein